MTLKFHGHRRYTPDFFLPEHDFFIEVKGFWRDRDVHKLYMVLDEHPGCDIRYIDSTNIKVLTLDLPRFIDRFKRHDINMHAFKDVWSDDGKVDS